MTRSVEELRQESERSRAELAATADKLRQQITSTAEDIRHKVSPQHVKSEISEFITHKAQGWAEALKQRAVQNPMEAVAAGAFVTVPMLRLARGFSLPLLMVGTGLALTSKTVRDKAAETASPLIDRGREMMHDASKASSLGRSAVDTASSVRHGMMGEVKDAAAGVTDDLRNKAAETSATIADTLRNSMDDAAQMANDTLKGARSTVNRARSTISEVGSATSDAVASASKNARQAIGENAALIGGFGIAIGALLAASLPKSQTEAAVIGPAADGAKRAAGSALQSGFEEVKEAAMSAAAAAVKGATDTNPQAPSSAPAGRMEGESSKPFAEDVATAAVNSARN
jgi:hypothetical protein